VPTFRMTDEYPRIFHAYGRIEPDGTIEADENPDPHFFEAADAPAPEPEPAPDVPVSEVPEPETES